MSAPPVLRAVRGAITVPEDRGELVTEATAELLAALLSANELTLEDITSAYFTATPDLRSEFPAKGARALGWHEVPMLCAQEIDVAGALGRCIRVMLHVTLPAGRELRPVYLREAQSLRPDLEPGTFPPCPPPTPPGAPAPPAWNPSSPPSSLRSGSSRRRSSREG